MSQSSGLLQTCIRHFAVNRALKRARQCARRCKCPCGGMVDASDSKSDGEIRAGSSPARGTIKRLSIVCVSRTLGSGKATGRVRKWPALGVVQPADMVWRRREADNSAPQSSRVSSIAIYPTRSEPHFIAGLLPADDARQMSRRNDGSAWSRSPPIRVRPDIVLRMTGFRGPCHCRKPAEYKFGKPFRLFGEHCMSGIL